MDASVFTEIEELHRMKAGALRIRYREVFGEESRSANKQFLFRRIAWRLQANAEGDLSERTRGRALELADDADLRILAPKSFFSDFHYTDPARPPDRAGAGKDRRLPAAGTL